MAIFLKLFVVIFAVHSAISDPVNLPDFLKYLPGQRYILYPVFGDLYRIVDLEDKTFVGTTRIAETDITYNLYTRNNTLIPQWLTRNDSSGFNASHFDKTKPTKIITHGWLNNGLSPTCQLIKDKMLDAADVNIICLDWAKYSFAPYFIAKYNVPIVASYLGQLIDWFVTQGVSLSSIHLIGHSLGAHISGIAGRGLKSGKVPYLTGLDPASMHWYSDVNRISKRDAKYVEIIHSSGGYAGLTDVLGHNDFYPNWGSVQPGCGIDVACFHGRAIEFFAYSIDNKKFMGKQCMSYGEMSLQRCSNISKLHMGGLKPKPARGLFFVKTTDAAPFY